MELQDSRRLTGLNLLSERAGAVAEVRFEAHEAPDEALTAWSGAVDTLLAGLGWPSQARWTRRWREGATLLLEAPLDALYAATEINEWAVAHASGRACALGEAITSIRASIAEETNPAMTALETAAVARDVPFVWDDDLVSVGMGRHSRAWPTLNLPSPDEVDWESVRSIPVAYITGTNGKTTSTRMTTRILQAAGMTPGCTSSDGVVVNGVEVERGDWTGPGAARRVLRHEDVDVAVLETARGGILRRGLVIDSCDVALITNIADDHLGEYGVLTVADMARAKGLVCEAVKPDGRRILNADDPYLVDLGRTEGAPVCWFSNQPMTPWLSTHLEEGGEAWVLDDGWLTFCQGPSRTQVVEALALPSSYGGTALHNVTNALGAAALSHALGVPLSAIKEGLLDFGTEQTDNPGRCQLHAPHGVQVLLDFGHNPHGVRAILAMAREMLASRPEARLWVSLGQAGDRSDSDLLGLSEAVWEAHPDSVSLREVVGYERGRARREVAGIMSEKLMSLGLRPEGIHFHDDEVAAVKAALDWARPGDLIVHLIHIQREAVQEVLNQWTPQ